MGRSVEGRCSGPPSSSDFERATAVEGPGTALAAERGGFRRDTGTAVAVPLAPATARMSRCQTKRPARIRPPRDDRRPAPGVPERGSGSSPSACGVRRAERGHQEAEGFGVGFGPRRPSTAAPRVARARGCRPSAVARARGSPGQACLSRFASSCGHAHSTPKRPETDPARRAKRSRPDRPQCRSAHGIVVDRRRSSRPPARPVTPEVAGSSPVARVRSWCGSAPQSAQTPDRRRGQMVARTVQERSSVACSRACCRSGNGRCRTTSRIVNLARVRGRRLVQGITKREDSFMRLTIVLVHGAFADSSNWDVGT